MELFAPLTLFYTAIAQDARIGATHISLYMALLQQWNLSGGTNPIEIKRRPIMKAAKIYGRHTYNKCMKELHTYGYIIYKPSLNVYAASVVELKTEISPK